MYSLKYWITTYQFHSLILKLYWTLFLEKSIIFLVSLYLCIWKTYQYLEKRVSLKNNENI